MLLFHEVCHSSKTYLLIDGLKLENGILKEVGSNTLRQVLVYYLYVKYGCEAFRIFHKKKTVSLPTL